MSAGKPLEDNKMEKIRGNLRQKFIEDVIPKEELKEDINLKRRVLKNCLFNSISTSRWNETDTALFLLFL